MRKNLLWTFLTTLLILSVLNVNTMKVSAVKSPYIKVIPESTVDSTLTPGQNYTISIYTDCTNNDITGYQFTLNYNPNILKGVEVVNGDLIVGGSAKFLAGRFDNEAGNLSLTVGFFFEEGEVTSGPRTLAYVTFRVVGYGTSNITIGFRTKLIGWDWWKEPPDYGIIDAESMPDHIQHGYFCNTEEHVTHDIAVIGVTPSATRVKLGGLVNITVAVENQGTEPETFDVTVDYDNTTIKTETVPNLAPSTNTSLIFIWNTTDLREEIYATYRKEKIYTIKAAASTVPGETDTTDNTLISPSKVRVISQYIAVIPLSTVDPDLTPGMNYTVSIYTDYNGTDVWGWQFTLSYNPLVLHGVKVTNGDLINKDKHPDAAFIAGTFNNDLGKLSLTAAFFFYTTKPFPLTSGPGTLANVTFTVVGTGDSDITLVESKTKLTGYNATTEEFYEIVSDWKPGIGHILHGYFRNTVEAVTHDVAILSVTPSTTTVTKGDLVNITVVVENQGTVPETITVAAYYDSIDPNYRIATTKTVQSLEAGANVSLTFVWNTMGVTAGSHTIWAEAGTVPGETDTEDNTLESDETVTVLQHELAVSLRALDFLMPGDSTLLNATVYNHGINETSVELQLLINGSTVNSTVIDFLPFGASYTLSYLWTPTVEATYNVTVYAPPVPGENIKVNNVETKFVTVTYPIIHPMEGQWANYTLCYVEYDRIIGTGKWNLTYDHYVSPYLIKITMWQETMGYAYTYQVIVNIMNREIESISGPMPGPKQWFFGWIETDIALDSTVNLLYSNATVVGSRIIEVDGYFVDCWELEYHVYYYPYPPIPQTPYYYLYPIISQPKYTLWYDKVSGLLIGMELGSDYYRINLKLDATNIPIGVLPVASFTYTPSEPVVAETLAFNATDSYDPDGETVSYTWDFGDGTTGSGMIVTHAYAKAGTYTVTLTVTDDDGLTNTTTSAVTVSRTTLDIEVDVGSIHFRGEMAEFYVLVSSMGEPVDADISATLYYSNGTLHEDLTGSVEHTATGLYWVPYTMPLDAPAGTYALVVNASFLTLKGASVKSFLLSPTLTSWNAWLVDVQGDIATIETDVATIKVSLEAINARLEGIEEMLPFKNRNVAVIKTDIGTVRADLSDINAELIALDGSKATIKTDVGTLNTDTESIELKVTNVDGDIATISTTLGTIQGRVLSIQGDLATIETDIGVVEAPLPQTKATPAGISLEWTLLLFAAIAFIIAIAAVLLKKLKRTSHTKPTIPYFF